MPYQKAIRLNLAEIFNSSQNVFIVDGMPLEVYKISRSSCRENRSITNICYRRMNLQQL